jgi:hypothetical protein
MTAANASVEQFVASIDFSALPVFARTIAEIGKLAPRGERAPLPELTELVLHDPLLMLRLLHTVNSRRSRLGAEITTVEHAIMMMGVQPFFQRFSRLVSVDDHLRARPAALATVRRAASRAHHAAYQARDWAIQRADIESEEVFVAATLAEVTEMVLACFAPEPAPAFPPSRLRDALFDACRIPDLLRDMVDTGKSGHPRTVNVTLALSVARRAEAGWWDRALAQDMEAAAALLHLSVDDAVARIHRTAVLAARAWRWYGAVPAAAGLVLLPAAESPQPAIATQPAATAPRSSSELIGWALDALRRELGLGRVMFALASPDRQSLKAKWTEGVAADSPMAGFTLGLGRHNLFAQLLGKPQSVWLHDANRANLEPFITPDMLRLLGRDDFFAMSIFFNDRPLGLLYADARGGTAKRLDETAYRGFKQVGARVSQGLQQLAGARPA